MDKTEGRRRQTLNTIFPLWGREVTGGMNGNKHNSKRRLEHIVRSAVLCRLFPSLALIIFDFVAPKLKLYVTYA